MKSIPARTRNALIKEGITTLEQLEGLTDAELMRIPDMGRYSLHCIKEAVVGPAPNLTLGEQRRMLQEWRGRKPA